ncbi:LEAF RUST 10 DISEASE-RESISTANCE LOCUS RECEPTOR-LIKE PROTEIN KINASE-like 1.2 [Durio zibethinus]|uniref:non-specific serine/threonine protein kinase n=1 Tax=Durio zibethinus TaxID=66656 RepID=A0A6P6AMH7_DURZI|nr:LEAF RUST 10 DISEASE-RESISTANCE LOCUS RECEPTOR-LIKE PROTEIN KINASE-like 1.2 [Durio zibethinus]
MDAFFLLPSSFSIISIFLLLNFFEVSYALDDLHFTGCSPFNCGNLRNFSYPFWTDDQQRPSYCGYDSEEFKLKCIQNQPPVMTMSSQEFLVLYLNSSHGLITIQRVEFEENTCPQEVLINNSFNYSDTAENITLSYGCQSGELTNHSFTCKKDGSETFAMLFKSNESECDGEKVEIPIGNKAFDEFMRGIAALNETLVQPFDIKYFAYDHYCRQCKHSGGRCGSNKTSPGTFVCYCRDRPYQLICKRSEPDRNDFNLGAKLAIGFGAAIGGLIISSIVFYYRPHRRHGRMFFKSSCVSGKSSFDRSFMMDPEMGDSFAGIHLFSYNELEEATNSFDSDMEVGDGGFGTVYYGKLRDGRAVAVKRLYENNYKRVEQFMNEVEILSRLRHQNLVSLYGCTSRHSRELLLVYEYVPNGTVADHLHGQRAKPGALSWPIRLEIAIETANALRYLHASDTIHRDVKTNNILLDDNFIVKVADFGLSRLFPTNVTHISTAPQGTPGYVDPEYHQCYQLTDKSDVFSFGVVLIELISSKPAVDITRHRHEINLSNMAINKIQNRALHDLVDPSLGFESDYKVRKMITGVAEVAFQCLQHEKDMRPTMAQVLEALMGLQNEDYDKGKAEEMDISTDEVGLLKSEAQPPSPDSVEIKWVSSFTTLSIGNNKEKAEEMDISADEVGLLKSGPLPHSPDSVMIKWVSSSTTPSMSH